MKDHAELGLDQLLLFCVCLVWNRLVQVPVPSVSQYLLLWDLGSSSSWTVSCITWCQPGTTLWARSANSRWGIPSASCGASVWQG